MFEPLRQALRASIVFAGHLAITALNLIGIWLVEQLIHWLWGEEDPVLFGRLPLQYVFDLLHAGILMTLFFWGVVAINDVYKGKSQ
jgi:hypothetical protein